MASNLNDDEKAQLEAMMERTTISDVLEYIAECLHAEADRCREAVRLIEAQQARKDAARLERFANKYF